MFNAFAKDLNLYMESVTVLVIDTIHVCLSGIFGIDDAGSSHLRESDKAHGSCFSL